MPSVAILEAEGRDTLILDSRAPNGRLHGLRSHEVDGWRPFRRRTCPRGLFDVITLRYSGNFAGELAASMQSDEFQH
jgi:hypothetical protein